MKEKFYLHELVRHGDDRGSLVAFENGINVPFDVKRVFYIYDTKDDVSRGSHANRNSKFLLVVISGSCRVKIDDGINQVNILLNKPHQSLFIEKMVWKEMYEFSYNSVLLVLSSEFYNESEYIRNYNEFMKELYDH